VDSIETRGNFQLLNCSDKKGNIRIKKGQGGQWTVRNNLIEK
jgi:hypothetical protein